ncbi:hypothetical protein sS8_4406 [Methylocaldum marinum]|uniref:Uncharacterized protein n=1 Tax=Methylocaldum marinum TaxID=1432792 RepID=A0A250KXT4_9GAMM|nr:hypothetical protein [Methylocaldum marinum]BBA36336.1 hypothetical protein sS8_4406 [Methylocaldum marinum]
MKTTFTRGGLTLFALLSTALAHAESDFYAMDALFHQGVVASTDRLGDIALDRIEGGLDTGDMEALTQVYLVQAAALQTAANTTAANGSISQNQLDSTMSLTQVCESTCMQSARVTTLSHN